jgi:hypothetical protein
VEHTVIETNMMIDIERKAKGLVLESCLVASVMGSTVGGATYVFGRMQVAAISCLHCYTRCFATPLGPILVIRDVRHRPASLKTEILSWAS